MSRSVHFFGTRQDLRDLLSAVEDSWGLRYYRAGILPSVEPEYWDSGQLLPTLGMASTGDQSKEPWYLIVSQGTPVQTRQIPQRRGRVRYAIDQDLNPGSVVFRPGGAFEDALIAGQLGTTTEDPISIDLLDCFVREVRVQFERIRSYYVGKEAEIMLDRGHRLTACVYSSKEYDLSRA
jgi:hypothetical protein